MLTFFSPGSPIGPVVRVRVVFLHERKGIMTMSRRALLGATGAAVLTAPFWSPPEAFAAEPTIRYKSPDKEAVKRLQTQLKKLGFYELKIDGDAGLGTVNGLVHFQVSQGWWADAICGPLTWGRLYAPLPIRQGVPNMYMRTGGKLIYTDLRQGMSYFINGGRVEFESPSTGAGFTTVLRDGVEIKNEFKVFHTPALDTPVLAKKLNPTSRTYGEGKMPWTLQLNQKDTVRQHGSTSIGRRYGSHGCVREPMAVAERAYYWASVGTRYIIAR